MSYNDNLMPAFDAPVIVVDGVSKAYRMWSTPAARLYSPSLTALSRIMPFKGARHWLQTRAIGQYRDFWAVRDASFQVARGECVGIIGRNGSGKSTILQIIAGTLRASSGAVTVNGRVAALLELGSGFNPDFTGRENVYLNAAVLGFSRQQTEAKMEEIISFAEIGDFLDEPVKTYSSGMQLRLAFAVQTAVEPELLIVDEALSVGDEAFARKCIARVDRLRGKGTSILLVSHSSNLITTLCTRALLVDHGRILLNGSPKEVIARYHRMLFTGQSASGSDKQASVTDSDTGPVHAEAAARVDMADESYFDPSLISTATVAYEPRRVRIIDPHIVNASGKRVNCLSHGQAYKYRYCADILEDCFSVVCMCGFRSKEGFELGGIKSHPERSALEHLEANTRLVVEFKFRCSLLSETFFLNAGVMGILDGELTYLHRLVDVIAFRVLPDKGTRAAGLVDFGDIAEVRIETMRPAGQYDHTGRP